jgi:hypothetical protein
MKGNQAAVPGYLSNAPAIHVALRDLVSLEMWRVTGVFILKKTAGSND